MKSRRNRSAFVLLPLFCLVFPLLIVGCGKSSDAAPSAQQDQKRAERKRNSDK